YGLAENTVAVSFAPPQSGLRVERIEAEAFAATGEARVVGAGAGAGAGADSGANALTVVSVGVPIQGHRVRIVDADGRELADGRQGEIEAAGPSRMIGYHGEPEATAAAFAGEWLKTGDLGYTRDGELFVTGRKKDVIIRGGRNYYPQDIEAAATVA